MLPDKSSVLKNGVLCLGLIHGVTFPTFIEEQVSSQFAILPVLFSANAFYFNILVMLCH